MDFFDVVDLLRGKGERRQRRSGESEEWSQNHIQLPAVFDSNAKERGGEAGRKYRRESELDACVSRRLSVLAWWR